ncbi:ABC transporter [Pseudomonas sp. AFG_SD02_1510_Pfu_092]|uniref:ATP-binding cassette domain-containing protein n=1 Tax=Pseudomonas sp. AFG_SD02_1510_Pfu_092 TaxID=2259497 RepID=UPI000DEFD77A|nr:ATP-binding cassette domain-containing protein [Pseudomonas sp. AFG_SD02_1510_Pfu_092]RCL25136.1 ABC transporter [Pseudomonas sp. AFG_SD02_1510_Pfu_092]
MGTLIIKKLSFSYKDKSLFHTVNLHVAPGEAVGILGSNGAGKTTLFDLICKLRKPDHGEIISRAKHPAYLTQILTPPPQLRMSEVYELITHLNAPSKLCLSEALSRLNAWSPALSKRYSDISRKKASTCSYGEIRSFFTLTLLLMGSDLVILDEPTAGVDPEFRHFIWLGIKHACNEGASVLVSSHYTQEIAANCSRFYMLAHHQLEAFHSANQFLARYQAASLDEAFINASMSQDNVVLQSDGQGNLQSQQGAPRPELLDKR